MRPLNGYFVAAILQLYPRSFRERFGDEMLAAFHDHLDAILVTTNGSRFAAVKFTVVTLVGLLLSVLPRTSTTGAAVRSSPTSKARGPLACRTS